MTVFSKETEIERSLLHAWDRLDPANKFLLLSAASTVETEATPGARVCFEVLQGAFQRMRMIKRDYWDKHVRRGVSHHSGWLLCCQQR